MRISSAGFLRNLPRDNSLDGILDTNRYTLRYRIGKGCWGDVYEAVDNALGQIIAIKVLNPNETAKRQMQERNLSSFEAIAKEAGLAACSRIVPRSFDIDKNDTPFIVMPLYRNNLAKKLIENGKRRYLGHDLSLDDVLGYMKDIAIGLSEMHTVLFKTHCDLKPENILLTEGNQAHLTDLGTSTYASLSLVKSNGKRDNMGHLYTRAPECFELNAYPFHRSDCFSWAALSYRLITGKYPLEDELNQASNPEDYINRMTRKEFDKIIQDRVRRNIPARLQDIISRNLRYDVFRRDKDGEELFKNLEKSLEEVKIWRLFKRHFKSALVYSLVAFPIAVSGYLVSTHEPVELGKPENQIKVVSKINAKYLDNIDSIEFLKEDITDLPIDEKVPGYEELAKATTDNRIVAYLVKTHAQAAKSLGLFDGSKKEFTDYQFQCLNMYDYYTGNHGAMRMRYPGLPWSAWARSIEMAFEHAKSNGKYDLEDLMLISRMGPSQLLEAKRNYMSF